MTLSVEMIATVATGKGTSVNSFVKKPGNGWYHQKLGQYFPIKRVLEQEPNAALRVPE